MSIPQSAVDLSRCTVYVPVARLIEKDCELALRGLEALGVPVQRPYGANVDIVRNVCASQEIIKGSDSMMFIDSDIWFEPQDAIKLLNRPEPVVSGVYAKKAQGVHGTMAVDFEPNVKSIKLGPWADRTYPVRGIGAGFLRIRIDFLKRMIRELNLPYCRSGATFVWPFFQPSVVQFDGENYYLGEDNAFAWRCRQIGEPIQADTSFRLYHIGERGFSWEEAVGQVLPRPVNAVCEINRRPLSPKPALPPDLAGPGT
jgi:hypothetical protein